VALLIRSLWEAQGLYLCLNLASMSPLSSATVQADNLCLKGGGLGWVYCSAVSAVPVSVSASQPRITQTTDQGDEPLQYNSHDKTSIFFLCIVMNTIESILLLSLGKQQMYTTIQKFGAT
jgi:hypothetical protein